MEVRVNDRKITAGDDAEYTSNTEVDNLDVVRQMGVFRVLVNKKPIDIGTILKIKSTISQFRGMKQLAMKIVHVVESTNAEADAWAEVAEYKRSVLSQPWVLTTSHQNRIDRDLKAEDLKEWEHEKRRRKHDARNAERRREHEEKLARRREQKEQHYNAGALPGSNILKMPWQV